jgi:hypothetical protein
MKEDQLSKSMINRSSFRTYLNQSGGDLGFRRPSHSEIIAIICQGLDFLTLPVIADAYNWHLREEKYDQDVEHQQILTRRN